MSCERALSSPGKPVVIEASSTKAISHAGLGAVPSSGVVNVAMRKWKEKEGTTGSRYIRWISDTMDVTDNFLVMKGFYIIMDSCEEDRYKGW
ncbi:hypothetical protein G6F43_010175 [Rhizopus delemar]|nr:hypothetical protein G6F43_010175 [Rhizopus delemar]